jgi:type IV pilus assembly protein PilX
MKRQRGVALFFSLIVLIIMTVIGVALAVNSGQSLRMSGAGSERIEAQTLASGALDEVVAVNKGAVLASMTEAQTVTNSSLGGSQKLVPMPKDGTVQNVTCQRSSNASGAGLIACRRLEVSSTVSFGRDNLGRLTVVAGIEQEVLI